MTSYVSDFTAFYAAVNEPILQAGVGGASAHSLLPVVTSKLPLD